MVDRSPVGGTLGLYPKGRRFDSHRCQANLLDSPLWISQSNITDNILQLLSIGIDRY